MIDDVAQFGARLEHESVVCGVVEEDEGVEVGLDFNGGFGDGERRGVVFDVEWLWGGEEWREECVCVFCEW